MNQSKIEKKHNYIFNENYVLKNDKKRYILTNTLVHDIFFDKNSEDFPESVHTVMHPLLGLLFSLFNGTRSNEEVIAEYSKILAINKDVANQFVTDIFKDFVKEKKQKFIKFEDKYFFLPQNLLLKNTAKKKVKRKYHINDFFIPKKDLDLDSFRSYYPLDCMFELNFTCYTDCIYCYADRRNNDKCTIPFERIKELIKEAREIGMRTFDLCGGEVFMYSEWEKLLLELYKYDFRAYLSTKIPLTEEQIKKLKSTGQKDIQLSIDSIKPEELQKLLKVDLDYFYKMEKTLKCLEREDFDVFINGQITNVNNNPAHIKDMIEYFLSYSNVKRIKINTVGRSLYLDPKLFDNICDSVENIKKIEDLVTSYQEKNPHTEIAFGGYSTKEKFVRSDIKAKTKAYVERVKCSGNFYAFIILPDGKVTICEELYYHPAFVIGDLKHQSIMEVWNSDRALELYRLPKEKIRRESACKNCPQEEYDDCRQIKGVCWKEILNAYDHENWDYPDPKCPHAPEPFNKLWLD